jgi:hypothetical protein
MNTTVSVISENNNNNEILDNNCITLLNKGCTYFDILIFNCYDPANKIINRDKLYSAFDDLTSIYEKLFDFSLTLSGYQFIGLFLQSNLSDSITLELQIAYFILSSGFIISMFGALLCFVTIEYLRGCRDETTAFIIIGIKKYKHIFKSADKIIYFNCICFAVPINILIHNSLNLEFGIAYNIFSFLLFCIGIYYHFIIIVSRQQYILINNKQKTTYTRKIYL